jgi:hypothetical protein
LINGWIYHRYSKPLIIRNTTIFRSIGIELSLVEGGYVTIENSIFGSSSHNIGCWSNSSVDVSNSLMPNGNTYQPDPNPTFIKSSGDPPTNSNWGSNFISWGTNNIVASPQFVDSANGDYTLVSGSPGVDAGNPDLNGNGIPWQNDPEDQDPDGTRMDMGYGYAAQGPVVNFSSPIISSSSSDVTYAWSTGETTATINPTPTVTTTYYVSVNNGINSCQDSITVNVLPTSALTIDNTVCDSMFFAGNTITTSGTFYDTIVNSAGCDSIVTLNLTIHNSTKTNDIEVACDSTIWNGNVYDTSGIYIDTLQTIYGCDSVVTMDLTINNSFYAE